METDDQIKVFIENNYPVTNDSDKFLSELQKILDILDQAKSIYRKEIHESKSMDYSCIYYWCYFRLFCNPYCTFQCKAFAATNIKLLQGYPRSDHSRPVLYFCNLIQA